MAWHRSQNAVRTIRGSKLVLYSHSISVLLSSNLEFTENMSLLSHYRENLKSHNGIYLYLTEHMICFRTRTWRQTTRSMIHHECDMNVYLQSNKMSLVLYREINSFKRGYQTRNNLVKDENDDLHVDSYNILNN
jgi:hypothetical protein